MSEVEKELLDALRESGIGSTPTDVPDQSPQGRQRDAQGRFLPTEEEPPETPPSEGERLYAGRFKSQEELERGYLEADSHIGRLAADNGQLRQRIDEIEQRINTPPPPEYGDDDLMEFSPSDLVNVAVQAIQRNDEMGYRRAIATLHGLDPLAAQEINTRKLLLEQQNALLQRLEPQLQPLQQSMNSQQIGMAWRSFTTKYPDFGEHEPAMHELMRERIDLAERIEQGSAQEKEQAFETLLALARLRSGSAPNPSEQPQGTAPSGLQQRLQAGVVSSGGAGEMQPRSGQDIFRDLITEQMISGGLMDPD